MRICKEEVPIEEKNSLKRKSWGRINLEIGCSMNFWGKQGINLFNIHGDMSWR
jgi:hypothetical protein